MKENQATLVRTNRENNKLTQEQVSKKLGYSTSQFISNIERGAAGIPPILMTKFAKILKTDVRNIVGAYIKDTHNELIAITEPKKKKKQHARN